MQKFSIHVSQVCSFNVCNFAIYEERSIMFKPKYDFHLSISFHIIPYPFLHIFYPCIHLFKDESSHLIFLTIEVSGISC